ncbi:hypothetical protein LAD73_01525 [Mycoplasma sp. 1331]|uniref:Uncharacterized protein n=1 Tax=Mycoplasma tauri TaxID=547987 RepID=A0A953NG25_9MOLU|nr:hypothetical protein [Mycoplasma tauri]MBZ4195399.1 hypothetical protein [Mycoplasma tauri]
MSKNSKKVIGLIALASITSTAATWAIISGYKGDENNRRDQNVTDIYDSFNNVFKKYVDLLLPDNKWNNKTKNEIKKIDALLLDPSVSQLEKWKALYKVGNIENDVIFNWANALIESGNINESYIKKLQELFEGQAKRIQEKDLKSQFDHNKISDLNLAFSNFLSLPKEKQKEFINSYNEFFTKLIDQQYQLVEKHLMQNENSLDDNIATAHSLMPTKALRYSFDSNAQQIEEMLFNSEFRINDIARTKAFIEDTVKLYEASDNSKIINKFKSVTDEMNEIVNADSKNVINIIANRLLKDIEKNSQHARVIERLQKSADVNKSVSHNREIFDQLIKYAINNEIIPQSELNSTLSHSQVDVYNKLTEYFLTVTQYKLDGSKTVEDLENVLANLKTFRKMLQDRSKSNDEIVKEFNSFVKLQTDIDLGRTILNKILKNDDIKDIINASKPNELDKTALIETIIKYRNAINTIKSAEKNAINLKKYAESAYSISKLISLNEKKELIEQINDIFANSKEIPELLHYLSNKQKELELVIWARQDLQSIKSELKNDILHLNDFNEEISNIYLSENAKQLATDLLNEVSSFAQQKKFDATKIIENKQLFNEKLRAIEKIVLEHLENTTNVNLNKLNLMNSLQFLSLPESVRKELENKYISVEKIAQIVKTLNDETHKITDVKFNPIISKDLIAQIKKYKFVVNVLSATQKHNESILSLAKSKQYAETAFNLTGENPPKYSENAQLHLEKIANSQNELISNATNINELLRLHSSQEPLSADEQAKINNSEILNNPDSLKIFDKTLSLVNNNQKISEIINNADSALNKLDVLFKGIEAEYENLDLFQTEVSEVEKIKQAIKDELSGNQDSDKINELIKRADQILKETTEKRKEGSLGVRLNKLEEKLNSSFPNADESSQSNGEKKLRERLNIIRKQALNPNLTKEEKEKLANQADVLDSLIEKVKEVEKAIDGFNKKATEYLKDPEARTRTPESNFITIKTIDSMHALIADIVLSDEIPMPAAFHDKLKELEKRDEDLEISYNKDKLEVLSDQLDNEKFNLDVNSPDEAKSKFNDSITTIKSYADEKIKSKSLNEVQSGRALVTKEKDLIETLKKAIEAKQEIESDNELSSAISKKNTAVLDSIILNNMPNLSVEPHDNTQKIAEKIANVNKAVEEAKEKHELSKLIENSLKKVLSTDEQSNMVLLSVYDKLKKSIKENEDIVNANPGIYSAEQIKTAREELVKTIEKLKNEKTDLINQYNQVKEETNEIYAELQKRVDVNSTKAENKFDNFELAKKEYLNELADSTISTVESLKQRQKALIDAYNKDLATNAYNSYNKFISDNISNDSSNAELSPIKKLYEEFKQQIDERLKKPFTDQESSDFIQLTQQMKKFNETQKDIADTIQLLKGKHVENQHDVEVEKAIEQLRKLFGAQFSPSNPFTEDDIVKKHDYLIEEFKRIKEEAAKRTENKRWANDIFDYIDNFRNQPEIRDGKNKARVAANEVINEAMGTEVQLGDSVDPEISKIIEHNLEDIKEKNKNASTIDDANKIGEKLEAIKKLQPYINALALEVGSAIKITNENAGEDDKLIRSFVDIELQSLITQSRDLYGKVSEGSNVEDVFNRTKETIKQKIQAIESAKDNIRKAKAIKTKLSEAKQINDEIDYHSANGVSGEGNKLKVKSWLQLITSSASYGINNPDSKKTLDETENKISLALDLVKKIKLVSDEISKWRSERDLNPIVLALTQRDEDLLTTAMWSFVPNPSINLTHAQIQEKLDQLQSKFEELSNIRKARATTLIAINDIKLTSEYESLNTIPGLKNIVDGRIRKLNSDIEKAEGLDAINNVNNDVNTLRELLPKEIQLANKMDTSKDYNNTLTALNEKITAKKDEFSSEIVKANLLLSKDTPTHDELPQRKEEIERQIKKLDLHTARLNIFKQWTEWKQKIDNNGTIDAKEKEALNDKMDQFFEELSIELTDQTSNSDFIRISDKWLTGETENSIPYLLQKAIEFQNELDKAREVRLTSSLKVTSEAIESAYSSLAQDISKAEQLIENSKTKSVKDRTNLINDFKKHIREIVNAKKAAMDTLKAKANDLYELIKDDREIFIEEFKQQSIDSLQAYQLPNFASESFEPKSIIEKIDDLISNAKNQYQLQIKKAHDVQSARMDKALNELNEYSLAVTEANIWTTKAKSDFVNINNTVSEIETFKKSHVYFEDDFTKFAGLSVENNYASQYFAENQKLVKKANEMKLAFIASASNAINDAIGESNGKITGSLDAIKSVVNISTNSTPSNLFETLQLNEAKIMFEDLKSTNEKLKVEILSKITDNEQLKANLLAQYLEKVNKQINDFENFVAKLKANVSNIIQERENIEEILNNALSKPTGSDKDLIVSKYNEKYVEVTTLLNRLDKVTSDEFVQSYFMNADSANITKLLTNLNEFYNFVNSKEFNDFFINLIDNSNIEVKNNVVLEDFKDVVKKITHDVSEDINEIDVTNNSILLPLFESFGNTQIDLDNKFNPVYVRTYLIRDEHTKEWYTVLSQNGESKKTISVNLRYEYKAEGLLKFDNYKGFKSPRKANIEFNTEKTIGLQPKSRNIFYKDYKAASVRENAKEVIANTDRLGWTVSSKEQAIQQFVKKFKLAANFKDGKEVILDTVNGKLYRITDSDTNTYVEDKLNPDFNIKFILPQVFIYQQSTQVKGDTSRQFIRLRFEDEKRLVVEVVSPAQLVVGALNYQANKNTIHLENGVPKQEWAMPTALLTTIKFEFDWDEITKNLSMFISRYETYHVAKDKKLKANGNESWIDESVKYQTDSGFEATVWKDNDFAKWLVINNNIWKSPKGNSDESPVNQSDQHLRVTELNNKEGYPKDDKIIVKNPLFAGRYIWRDSNNEQKVLEGAKALNIYNTGIEKFEFNDIKEN